MFRRLLAAAFAVLVLLVAFQVRRDGDLPNAIAGRDRPDGTAGDNGYEVFEDDEVSLLCIEDLRDLCTRDLDLFGFAAKVEPAWTTVERLRDGGALGADVWLTVQPFPALAAPAPGAGRRGGLAEPTAVLARSPIVAVGPGAGVEARTAACPDAIVILACLGGTTAAGPTVARDASTSALGTLALTAVALELGAGPDAAWSSDAGVVDRLRAVVAGTRRSQAPLEDAMRIGGGALALTVEAEVVQHLDDIPYEERDAASASFGIRYPLDVRAVEVVAVPAPGFGRPRDLQTALLSSSAAYTFERSGWVAEDRPSFLHDVTLFDERPAVRTDLPWAPELVREVRRVAAG